MKLKIRYPKLDPNESPHIKDLAKQVGKFIQYWGFKSVQGEMWLYLYVSKEPLHSKQLAALLEISPSLVTQSVQTLLKYRVILTAGKTKNGVLRYMANPSVGDAISSVLQGREKKMLQDIQKSVHVAQKKFSKKTDQQLSREIAMDGQRLKNISDWTLQANQLLELMILSLKEI